MSLCQRDADLCVRLCSKYPLAMANVFFGSPRAMRRLGQRDAAVIDSQMRGLESELTEMTVAQPSPSGAIGGAVSLYLLLGGWRSW